MIVYNEFSLLQRNGWFGS